MKQTPGFPEAEVFLQSVLAKIRRRLAELDATLLEGKEDVDRMHDYYWENYTEMDEYGYENFDNQQALLMQINANNETLKLRSRFRKMADNPYFGRVDFLYDGDEESETFYIGIGNFSEKTGARSLIFDWRAPVSGLFYDYDCGRGSYEAPGGTMTGEVTEKWQYKIRRGRLIYAVSADTKIDDDILRQALAERGDTALKAIVRTIQKEQNAIIRNTDDKILVIQGAAGSGKTSVALHRVAYLLYHDRAHLKSSQVLILSPSRVFTDYISHILPELGEENIREMSFDVFACRELGQYIEDTEDIYDDIEYKLAGGLTSPDRAYKESPQCPEDLRGYALVLEDELMDLKPITIRGYVMPVEEVIRLFYFGFTEIPLLDRIDAIFDRAIDEWETLNGRELAEEEAAELREKALTMYETRDIYVLYSRFLKEQGRDPLPHLRRDKRILPYEDVYPMLYLKYLLMGRGDHSGIRHLVVDEMQDYSYLQYEILALLFKCPMTILGDKAQTMDSGERDVRTFLPSLLGKETRLISMDKSYRNTTEILRYAEGLRRGDKAVSHIEAFERQGEPVRELCLSDYGEIAREIVGRYLDRRGEIETAAVITFTQKEADDLFAALATAFEEAGLDPQREMTAISKFKGSFRPGLTVTTFYLAKGLEFDEVFALDREGEENKELYDQARYIMATRAMHALTVFKGKKES